MSILIGIIGIICIIRTIVYTVYEIKAKNITGAVSLLVLLAASIMLCIMYSL